MSILSRNALPLVTSLCLVLPAIAADYKPAWLREPSPQELEQQRLQEQERERKQAAHDQQTELRKVCKVLLEPFVSNHARLSGETKLAAELLLDYHKAGLSCFEPQDGPTR